MVHPIYDAIMAATTPAERRRIKASALGILTDMIGQSILVGGGAFRVTLTGVGIHWAQEMLEMTVRVNRVSNGKDVTPNDLNPIQVVNPPILVDDPAGDIVLHWTDAQGVAQTRTLREDLRGCLVTIVRDMARQRLGA